MAEFNLQEVLDECRKSARIGYDLASSQYKRLRDTIASAESKIEDTLIAFNSSTCYLSDATASLSQQLSETRSAIDQLSFAFQEDLQKLKETSANFPSLCLAER